MNTRERLLATLNFEPCDHPPYWEWAYWPETLDRWYGEGLERQVGYPASMLKSEPLNGGAGDWRPPMPREGDAKRELDLDEGFFHPPVWGRIPLPYEKLILEEGEHFQVIRDTDGVTKKILTDSMSMPMFMSYPIKNRHDWEEMKANLNMSFRDRIPPDWEAMTAPLRDSRRTFPVSLLGFPEGLFGQLRDLLGVDYLLFALYDDPDMLHEILDVMTGLWISLWEEEVAQFEVDSVTFWEDMCFRSGPLISPKMFQTFLSPRYKRLTEAGRSLGIKHYLVDSDGDMRKLIPLWMEAGITGVYPFEVQAGMNVEEIGHQYPDLVVIGGIDKREIDLGSEAIDRELEKRLPFLLQRSGFIPTLDHHVTPEVSWPDFVYYRKKVAQACERLSPNVKRK
jgi:uroporphyrinogen-III decarboxylase